jgi:hypothetical protein
MAACHFSKEFCANSRKVIPKGKEKMHSAVFKRARQIQKVLVLNG